MRTLALLIFLCVLTPFLYGQKKSSLPKDGNGLLDYCGALVDSEDNPSYFTSLNGDRFAEKFGQLDWCAGYLDAIQDTLVHIHVNLTLMSMTHVTLEGPDKERAIWLDTLPIACGPDEVPILQLARVVVKWLREHPERLHEPKGVLAIEALRDAFPCQHASPKEAAKPPTVKP